MCASRLKSIAPIPLRLSQYRPQGRLTFPLPISTKTFANIFANLAPGMNGSVKDKNGSPLGNCWLGPYRWSVSLVFAGSPKRLPHRADSIRYPIILASGINCLWGNCREDAKRGFFPTCGTTANNSALGIRKGELSDLGLAFGVQVGFHENTSRP